MKYKARYRKTGLNPFTSVGPKNHFPEDAIISRTAKFPDNIVLEDIERMAKQATPDGYEFINVCPADIE